MKFYCFGIANTNLKFSEIESVLQRLSETSDTTDLVVSLYFSNNLNHHHRGRAYVSQWMKPEQFTTLRGYWQFTRKWSVPDDLPMQYKLIRMVLNADPKAYPKKEFDIYGWQFKYESFKDHLALLFAHELHHFRRYHLNLHPREGENKANQWALEQCQKLGFKVNGQKVLVKTKKKKKNVLRGIYDPFKSFRVLKSGDKVRILKDPQDRYHDQLAEVIRPIRSNSKRMVIQTTDGKTWRWPLNWLTLK